jgi:hypothetical protein
MIYMVSSVCVIYFMPVLIGGDLLDHCILMVDGICWLKIVIFNCLVSLSY